jgi:hypothetical protein
MVYLVEPNNVPKAARDECILFCGIKPCYGVPPDTW